MNKQEANQCVKDILAQLKPWAADHDYTINHKKCVFDPFAGFTDITITVMRSDGVPAELYDLQQYAKDSFTDIKPEWVGADIMFRKRIGKLVGYVARAYKYPFIIQMGNGDQFKVTEATIVRKLGAPSVSAALVN